MLALEPVITARVQAALADLAVAWTCIGFSTTEGARDTYPLASVMLAAARVADSKTGAANVQPAWAVTLVARRGPGAAAEIDTAIAAVIAALHNWPPGVVSGRTWNHLALEQAAPPQYADAGLVGVELTFTTHARYDGQS